MSVNLNILRQQFILQELGYYKGQLDGVWSKKTFDAKIKWENDRNRSFAPAIPNHGRPFDLSAPLPKGFYVDKEGLLNITGKAITTEQMIQKQAKVAKPQAPVKKKDIGSEAVDVVKQDKPEAGDE